MDQGPITLNFTTKEEPFPKGEIIITEKLGTSCVKPKRELKDLKIDEKTYESLKNQIEKYIGVQPEGFTTGKGKDRRIDVDTLDVPDRHKEFPFSAICALDIFFDDSVYTSGTGFMIGSRYMLTAAHNLYQNKKIAKDVYVSPGRRRASNPFGVYKVTHAFLFTNSYEWSYYDDMAVIALDYEIGDYTGWFGMIDLNYDDLKQSMQDQPDDFCLGKRDTHVCGYDPPKFRQTNLVLQSLKIHSGDLVNKSLLGSAFVRDDILCYDIDTVRGQSGSPVWILSGQNCYAVGVHNNFAEGQKSNIGPRLTREKITKICDLIGKQNFSFSGPINAKAPEDLEEVLESFKNCKNEEEKNRLIGFLSSFKHYRLMDPLQMKEKIHENILEKTFEKVPEKIIKNSDTISLFEDLKDFEVYCKIYTKETKKSLDLVLKKESFMKDIQSIQALKDQDKIDSLSLDFQNHIEHKRFKTILKMLPKIPKLYHLDMKINTSNRLDLADLLSRVPNSQYFDLYITQIFYDESIQDCKDILTSILKKNPEINLYLEFEFDQFDVKQIDHTLLKISNSENSIIYIYPLKSGFCILVNDPRHEITESNIQTMNSRKSIFKCLKLIVKSSIYEDKNFTELLRDIMNDKRFIQFGEISYSNAYNHNYIANSGFNILYDHDSLHDLIEISLALNEKVFDSIDQKNAKIFLNKIKSINFTFKGTQSDDYTISNLSKLIFDCQILNHLELNFYGCDKITDAGLKALSSMLKNLRSNLLIFSVDFTGCKSISDVGMKELSRSIQHLSNITDLNLTFYYCQSISDAGVKELSQSIQHLSTISNLSLIFYYCKSISDAGVKVLSQSIQHLSNISNLTLKFGGYGSSISDAGMKELSQSIQHLSNISNLTLDFSHCQSIGDAGMKELSQSIQNLTTISNFNVNFSVCPEISDAGIKQLFQAIQNLSNVLNLTLNFSLCLSISDAGMIELSQSIQHLSNIFNLNLNFCLCSSICYAGVKELLQSIHKLSNISHLTLNFIGCSKISDAGMKKLSQSILNLSNITSFHLNEHRII